MSAIRHAQRQLPRPIEKLAPLPDFTHRSERGKLEPSNPLAPGSADERKAMSDQMTDAELLSWKVSAGDKVNKGDILCEISTDKVDMDLDSPFTGEILSLKVEEGDVVNVGDAIAEIETEEDSLLGSIFD